MALRKAPPGTHRARHWHGVWARNCGNTQHWSCLRQFELYRAYHYHLSGLVTIPQYLYPNYFR